MKKSSFFMTRVVPPVIPLILVIILLEFFVRRGFIASFLMPPPSEVWASLRDDRAELFEAFSSTTIAAFIGLALSIFFGTLSAIVLSISSGVRRAVYPYAIFFQTVPIIAIAPLLVIWFGFGRPTVVASAFIVSIFPVIASVLLGLQSTEPALVDLFRLYSASRTSVLFKLRLPYALPQIFSGVRIASGLAVIGAIVGEFIAGGGLGSVVDAARTQQRIDKVFAAVLISAGLGLVMVSLIDLLSWFTLRRWHASYSRHSQ
ncbi:MAG TPA: ABC transporter permease [Bdellovibrionales bacterium]|jgi:NitT/TauT family transport system permease protein|nr:ABC transporter permease [Bdellovibrionales bacterium]